jgi:signal transduction histidine kinase
MAETLHILVIDDSEDDRLLYRRALKKSPDTLYEIAEADNGESGLDALEHHRPDCILLDYSLPGRNGVEVLKRIRALDAHVPVVILTGQGNETVAVAAMKEGAQDYIAKSTITPDALERVVRVAIAHGRMQQRIHEQRTSLEVFTYALAHDLREPTHTIRAFSALIADNEKNMSEKNRGYLTHIQNAADRMRQLIDAVYLYTRLDAAEEMEKENCSLSTVLSEVTENLGQLIQSEHAVITSDPLPTALVNRTQMQQLLQNLISNAIRHGGKNVAIHVGARETPEHWEIFVRDNGPGVASEHRETIFDPFKRMSGGRERGLGMGLAIARKIAEFHGGKIWCESAPGQGATFIFTLPRAVPATARPSRPATAPALQVNGHAHAAADDTPRRFARVLLVDDNEADIVLNRLMLIEQSQLQCEVLAASNGQEALDKLREAQKQGNPIDLVLLDINMPVMSGYEMLAKLYMDPDLNQTVVVMCSTSDHDLDRRLATSMGAAGYLVKPPQFPEFKAIVEENPHLMLKQEGGYLALLRAA